MKMSRRKARLWDLKRQGYELRFPGGTSRDGKSTSFAVCFRETREGPEILMIPYKDTGESEHDEDEEEFPEHPKGTLEREFLEETGVRLIKYDDLSKRSFTDKFDETKQHTQYAYLVTSYDDSNMREETNPFKKLGPPDWVPVSLLKEPHFMFTGHAWIFSGFDEWYRKIKVSKKGATSFSQGVCV